MCKQWIRLISKVSKRIINRYVLDLKAGTDAWLVYPNLFLIQCIGICKCLLKIIYTAAHIKNMIDV